MSLLLATFVPKKFLYNFTMPTFKPEIQNRRSDGTYNVRIRVTHNTKVKRISTNIYATDAEVTGTLKLKDGKTMYQINGLIQKCREVCNSMGMEIQSMSVDAIVDKLKYILTGGTTFRLDFMQYAETKIPNLSKGTGAIYKAAVNALRRHIMRDELDISEINVAFLRGFERFIESEPSRRGNNRKTSGEKIKKGTRAVSLYMSCIRALYNQAKEEFNDVDRGIINIPYSPFEHYKVKPQPPTRKRAISVDLIQKVIALPYRRELPGRWSSYNVAKDCFLLSFMLIGMNSADMYYVLPPKDGILVYNRRKTTTRRADLAEMRVRVEDIAETLINKYRDLSGQRLFNFASHYADFKVFNKTINEGLKEIGAEIGVERLTLYAARHSWATIARSAAVGIDKATVHEALNHVDKDMKVTDIYIDKDWSVIWNANKKVLDLFDWSDLELLYLL